HVLGSVRLGADDEHSDLDVLVVAPPSLPRAALFERLQGALASAGALDRVRVVEEAFVPALKLVVGGVEVDVSHAALPEGVGLAAPAQLGQAVLDRLDPPSRRAILGALEADALFARAAERVGADAFRALLRALKAWARARGVLGNGLGFLGGFSWAVLA